MRIRAVGAGLIAAWLLFPYSIGVLAADVSELRKPVSVVEVLMEDGLLTMQAKDVPVSDVLLAIGSQAGFEIVFVGDFSMPVTASFTRVRVWRALDQLTSGFNRAVSYAHPATGHGEPVVSRVWLLGPGNGQMPFPVTRDEQDRGEALQSDDAKARGIALLRLANQGTTAETLATVIAALEHDPDPMVRNQAAMALGVLGDSQALPALISAMTNDEHLTVRIQATQATGQIGGESAVQALGEILINGDNKRQRIISAWALAKQDTDLARWFLDRAANDPDKQIRDAVLNPPLWIPEPDSDLPFSGPEATE